MLTTQLIPETKKGFCFDLNPDPEKGPVREERSLPLEHPRRRSGFPRSTIADSDHWDLSVFQPKSKVVSCYSEQIFSPGLKSGFSSLKPASGMMKPDCGTWLKKEESEDQIRNIYHNCGSLSCPVCAWSELITKSNNAQERFENYELLKNAENAELIPGEKREYKPRQFVFTISPVHESELIAKTFRACGRWSEAVFLELARAEFNPALKSSGLIGGLIVYHDARLQHPDTGQTGKTGKHLIVMEAKLSGNMKDEDPSWKIYRHIAKQKHAGEYYYFSPHFHVIAYGKIKPVSEFEGSLNGWTYHNKKEVKTAGGLAYYLFSHQAMIDTKKSVSWFGRLSSVNFGKEEVRTYEKVEICSETGKPWTIIDSIYAGEIGKEHVNSITEYRYFFRVHTPDELPVLPEERHALILKIIHSYPAYRRAMFDKQVKKGAIASFAPYQRPTIPAGIRETGILALAKFVDEYGRL